MNGQVPMTQVCGQWHRCSDSQVRFGATVPPGCRDVTAQVHRTLPVPAGSFAYVPRCFVCHPGGEA